MHWHVEPIIYMKCPWCENDFTRPRTRTRSYPIAGTALTIVLAGVFKFTYMVGCFICKLLLLISTVKDMNGSLFLALLRQVSLIIM